MSGWMTCAEVAEEVGVSTRTVLRWIDRGDLPAVRLPGGRLRVSQVAFVEHLAAWQTTSTPEAYAVADNAERPGDAQTPPARHGGIAPCN